MKPKDKKPSREFPTGSLWQRADGIRVCILKASRIEVTYFYMQKRFTPYCQTPSDFKSMFKLIDNKPHDGDAHMHQSKHTSRKNSTR